MRDVHSEPGVGSNSKVVPLCVPQAPCSESLRLACYSDYSAMASLLNDAR